MGKHFLLIYLLPCAKHVHTESEFGREDRYKMPAPGFEENIKTLLLPVVCRVPPCWEKEISWAVELKECLGGNMDVECEYHANYK